MTDDLTKRAHRLQRGTHRLGPTMLHTRHPHPLIGRVEIGREIHAAHMHPIAQHLAVIIKPLAADGDGSMCPHGAETAGRLAILKPAMEARHG